MNKLKLSGIQHKLLEQHLFPGDGKEAVAIALCGRNAWENDHTLTVRELLLIPYDACIERKPDLVRWPTELINGLLAKAAERNYAIVKIHCHPGGGEFFSEYDDYSDQELFSSIHVWLQSDQPHGSCIMLPGGRMFGRFFLPDMNQQHIDKISVAGSDIHQWTYNGVAEFNEQLQARNLQAFGKKTVAVLSQMRIGVIGCSGTGSVVIEQLKRLGVGKLVLVDPDKIDMVNLNRIIGSTLEDATSSVMKTEVMAREIQKVGFGTRVVTFSTDVTTRDVVKTLAQCDALFGCVDSAEGRHMADLISSFYIIPLFDLGVRLQADGAGGIADIFGTAHYIQPGGSSLLSRGVYNMEQVRADGSRRVNKEEAEKDRYLLAANESSPAVISVNMAVASTAVNDFLARIHPFRRVSNAEIDCLRISLADVLSYPDSYPDPCGYLSRHVGRGDMEPLLNHAELSAP